MADDGGGVDVVIGTASRVYSMPWKHINGNTCIKIKNKLKQQQTAVTFLYNIWMCFLHKTLDLQIILIYDKLAEKWKLHMPQQMHQRLAAIQVLVMYKCIAHFFLVKL